MKIKLFGRTITINNTITSLPPLGSESGWTNYLAGKGYSVSASSAIKVAAVIRCCDVVSKTMASLPLNLYQSTDKGREKADKHRLYKLLYRLPNPETTSYEFWHMYVFNLMLTRGAYAKIVRDRNGFIKQIWNIPTANVSKFFNTISSERYIVVNLGNNKTETLREGEFMYTPGLRFASAIDPENPVLIASEILGLTMALNGYAKDFFENGSNLGGFISAPAGTNLDDVAYERFKESWQSAYSGVLNQHKVAYLEDGLEYTAVGKNPTESQALESRKFEVTEICRMFGVPPHKVFDLDRATFSNIEQQNIEYVQESITPMAVRIEQTIYKDLLTEKEQETYYAKFNVNGLLRGDLAARTTYYHNARQDGWMNANEIRALEDMNTIDDADGGNVYAINGNMIPLTAVPQNLPKGAQNGK